MTEMAISSAELPPRSNPTGVYNALKSIFSPSSFRNLRMNVVALLREDSSPT